MKKEDLTASKIAKKTKARNQALRDEMQDYINDVDKILSNHTINSKNIILLIIIMIKLLI